MAHIRVPVGAQSREGWLSYVGALRIIPGTEKGVMEGKRQPTKRLGWDGMLDLVLVRHGDDARK